MDKFYTPRRLNIFTPRACPIPPQCGLRDCECSFFVDHVAIAVCNHNRITDDTFQVKFNGQTVGTVQAVGEQPGCFSGGTGLWATSAPFPTWAQFSAYVFGLTEEQAKIAHVCEMEGIWTQGRLPEAWLSNDETVIEINYTEPSRGCGNLGMIQVIGFSVEKRRAGWCFGSTYGGAHVNKGDTPPPETFTIPYGTGEMITHIKDAPESAVPSARPGVVANGRPMTARDFAAPARPELIAARLAVCEFCDYRDGLKCGCGEPLANKTGRLYGMCPRWRWNSVNKRFGL